MKPVLIFAFILFCNATNAQIDLKIKELRVSYIVAKGELNEDSEQGPYVDIALLFENNTDTALFLTPPGSEISLSFNYKGNRYNSNLVSFGFGDNKKITLLSKNSLDVSVGQYLLLGTDIYKEGKRDYTKEMLEILPTLKVCYIDNFNKIRSNEIVKVTTLFFP